MFLETQFTPHTRSITIFEATPGQYSHCTRPGRVRSWPSSPKRAGFDLVLPWIGESGDHSTTTAEMTLGGLNHAKFHLKQLTHARIPNGSDRQVSYRPPVHEERYGMGCMATSPNNSSCLCSLFKFQVTECSKKNI